MLNREHDKVGYALYKTIRRQSSFSVQVVSYSARDRGLEFGFVHNRTKEGNKIEENEVENTSKRTRTYLHCD